MFWPFTHTHAPYTSAQASAAVLFTAVAGVAMNLKSKELTLQVRSSLTPHAAWEGRL